MPEPSSPICEECLDSPSSKETFNRGGDPSASVHLRVKGTEEWLVARNTALEWIKTNRKKFGSLKLKSIEVRPIDGTNCWDIYIEYGDKESEPKVVLDYRFQTSGGKRHTDFTYQTIDSQSCIAGLPPYDFGGAIGVTPTGAIQGTEMKFPVYSWSQTQAYTVEEMTASFRRRLALYTASVNSAPFMGFEPGEVLFEGVTDGQLCHETNPDSGGIFSYYKLTFSFSAIPNQTGIVIGDAVVDKKGWEYVWILWNTISRKGMTTKYPRNVSVEQLYPLRDLNDLGLMTL